MKANSFIYIYFVFENKSNEERVCCSNLGSHCLTTLINSLSMLDECKYFHNI